MFGASQTASKRVGEGEARLRKPASQRDCVGVHVCVGVGDRAEANLIHRGDNATLVGVSFGAKIQGRTSAHGSKNDDESGFFFSQSIRYSFLSPPCELTGIGWIYRGNRSFFDNTRVCEVCQEITNDLSHDVGLYRPSLLWARRERSIGGCSYRSRWRDDLDPIECVFHLSTLVRHIAHKR